MWLSFFTLCCVLFSILFLSCLLACVCFCLSQSPMPFLSALLWPLCFACYWHSCGLQVGLTPSLFFFSPPNKHTRRTFDQAPSSQLLLLQQQLAQLQQQAQLQKPSGPFGLDLQVINEIEKDWVRVDHMELKSVTNVDISPLDEPIKIRPVAGGVQYPQEKFDRLISCQHYLQQTLTTSPSSAGGVASGISPYRSPMRLQLQQQPQQVDNNMPK